MWYIYTIIAVVLLVAELMYFKINAICVDDLGFLSFLFPSIQFMPELKEQVLNDIIDPAFATTEPALLLPRIIYKLRRWKGNSWKHEFCYDESRWSAFWYGIKNHLIKPLHYE